MKVLASTTFLACCTLLTFAPPAALVAQGAANPVSSAFKSQLDQAERNLVAAGDDMPADKFSYKPTPEQMTFGQVMVHLASGNDYMCGTIGGVKAPERSKVAPTDSKETLVARLKETFQFCHTALANVDDSKLGEELPFFGGRKVSRAALMLIMSEDWGDHYSQVANYMRLNGVLPPTARHHHPE